jgi:hypothetical protein
LRPAVLPQKGEKMLGIKNCAQLPINEKSTHLQNRSMLFCKHVTTPITYLKLQVVCWDFILIQTFSGLVTSLIQFKKAIKHETQLKSQENISTKKRDFN